MEQKPLVLIDGKISQLPSGDSISGAGSSDFNLILTDNFFEVLVDNEGNVLTGV